MMQGKIYLHHKHDYVNRRNEEIRYFLGLNYVLLSLLETVYSILANCILKEERAFFNQPKHKYNNDVKAILRDKTKKMEKIN